jgi:hypothetical protein
MKVVHLSSVHPRYDTRIFIKECTSLVHAGIEVYFVVADGMGDEEKNGVHIIDAGPRKQSRLLRMIQTVLFHYKIIDVCFITCFYSCIY